MGEFAVTLSAAKFHSLALLLLFASGTPRDIVNKLNAAVNAVLAKPALAARFHELGGEPMPMSPVEFGKLIADETVKWAKVVKSAGLKAE
jgi:tripartite-type tricarboxylate transporter receptor subunit TctC